MSLREYMKPIKFHQTGLPKDMIKALYRVRPGFKQSQVVDLCQRCYDIILEQIERGFRGEVSITDGEKVAEAVEHLIIDAAILHEGLCNAGVVMGAFPYDDLADEILPPKAKSVPTVFKEAVETAGFVEYEKTLKDSLDRLQ